MCYYQCVSFEAIVMSSFSDFVDLGVISLPDS